LFHGDIEKFGCTEWKYERHFGGRAEILNIEIFTLNF
jgi:hypothetical protein